MMSLTFGSLARSFLLRWPLLRRLGALLPFFILLPLLAACATAPGTGRTIFTGGLSEKGEAELGRKEHPKVMAQYGGSYDDPALNAYVSSVGNLLVQTSELPDLKFTFTILDSPVVNAFALPGGYVYLTRGLLALAGNEAEMAGVMAHEIGHVTARHTAERYGQTMAANVAGAGLGVLLGGPAAQAGGALGGLLVRSYSREQEFEADMLGGRYLGRARYDTRAMAGFLSQLQAHGRLEAELAGQPEKADAFDIMQTHPRTTDRIERALEQAGVNRVEDPMVAQDIYFRKIDGLLFGDKPDEGYIRGRSFAHPKLKFAFEVPEGFRLYNQSNRVLARNGDGSAAIIFDRAGKGYKGAMTDYLGGVWGKNLSLSGLEAITVNGMDAATAGASNGQQSLRLLTLRYDAQTIYRFAFVTKPDQTASFNRGFRETTYSFRKLSDAEAGKLKPRRIRIHQVKAGETAGKIAARMPFVEENLKRFLVLNGFDRNVTLQTGQAVKIIAE
ncbi:M48 family metalloprotease [Pelagibius litoralis]|uniref:M48 family metalloprotease n=1 Tax=Pelagibius litoralis TaxID=374515 RepID=A0A967K9J5_9PROT|nr:M48 family metalloprotease [Pelagibius litoralis]NIA71083.1 M48 family metalloprotease [Pelagibius litoralis]